MRSKTLYFAPLSLFMLLPRAASAESLSMLIGGGTIGVGDLSFGNFGVTPQNGADSAEIDVLGVTNGSGDFGLSFTPSPAFSIAKGGSNEIIADLVFEVAVTDPNFLIHDVDQAFSADVSGSGIAAFDLTRVGQPHTLPSTVAGNCLNGDVAGCPQITGPADSAILARDVSFFEVEREVQLVRGRGGSGTGTLSSWQVTFSQTAAPTPSPSPVPEPVTSTLFGLGLACISGWKACRKAR